MSDTGGRSKAEIQTKAGLSRVCGLSEPVQLPCEVPALWRTQEMNAKAGQSRVQLRERVRQRAWYLEDAEKNEANRNRASGYEWTRL
jgi:hypothetical protein